MTRSASVQAGPEPVALPRPQPGASPADPLPLLKGLASLRQLTGMYPPEHPAIARKVREIHDAIQQQLEAGPAVEIDIIHGDVHLDGVPHRPDSQRTAEIVREMIDLGVHSIHIRSGVEPGELRSVGEFLWQVRDHAGTGPVAAELARRDVRHVTLGRLVPLDTRWRAMEWPDAPAGPLDPDYAQSLLAARQTFETVASGRGLDVVTVRDLVHLLIHQVARSHAALAQILAVKQYENLTYCHSVNVAMISLLLGKRLGFDGPTLTALVEAALLHDIGKTRIPLEIIKKPGALTKLERRMIETHTTFGAEILVETDGVRPLTPTVALEHHRTVGGRGYPDLGAIDPHPLSQIVAVADVYEAMTGARTYRVPSQPEQACLLLARLAGDRLNAALVKAFVNTVSFFPLGSLVRTSRDETGVVVRTNATDPLHPVIRLIDGDSGGLPREIDTSVRDAAGVFQRHIVESLRPKEGELDLTRVFPPDAAEA